MSGIDEEDDNDEDDEDDNEEEEAAAVTTGASVDLEIAHSACHSQAQGRRH